MSPKTALITGAAGDIGRAVAMRLAREEMHLVLADLQSMAPALEETQQLCRQAGATSSITTFDVTDANQGATAIDQAVADAGRLDLLFNNAGYQGLFANTLDYPVADFARVFEVNVTGAFSVLQAAARHMAQSGGGAIVNVASMAGVGGAPNMVAYSASKAAMIGLTKSAAKDLAPSGIRVNAISPAFIGPGAMWDRQVELQAETPSIYYSKDAPTVEAEMIGQVPMRRYGSVEEVADVAVFLLSDQSSYLTGINIEIAGGAS